MSAPVSVLGGLARKPLSDAGYRHAQRMIDEGVKDRARSVALAKTAYDNSRASQIVEQWTDLTAWTLTGASAVQVSNNRLYSTATNPGCAYRPLSAPAGGTVRIVGTVTSAGGSGGALIGMSKGIPGSGLGNQYGIYLNAGTARFQQCTNGALVDISTTNTIFQNRTYTYTITLDANYLSVVIVDPTTLVEWRAQFDRTTATGLTNLCVTNQHSAALTGAYFGPLGVVQANSTVTPRAGIEGLTPTVTWTRLTNPSLKGGKFGIRVALPASYDPSAVTSTGGYPVVFAFHNNGGSEVFIADNALNAPITNKLLQAGFIVASVGYDDTTSWGSPASIASYAAGYRYLRDNFAIGDVVFYANSMGSIESLLTLAGDQIPGVLAYAATSPTASLANNYANAAFTGLINTAYGVTATATTLTGPKSASSISVDMSTGAFVVGQKAVIEAGTGKEETVTVKAKTGASSPYTYTLVEPTRFQHDAGVAVTATYAQAAAGSDPVLKSGDSFRGVPMLLIHATDDTTVTKAENADAIAALVAPFSDDVTVIPAIGGHSFSSMPNFADQIANFYKRYLRIG